MAYRCDRSVICSVLLCSGERLTEKEVNEAMTYCCDWSVSVLFCCVQASGGCERDHGLPL